MSSTISIEIPREVLHAARLTPEELRRELALPVPAGQAILRQGSRDGWNDRVGIPTSLGEQGNSCSL